MKEFLAERSGFEKKVPHMVWKQMRLPPEKSLYDRFSLLAEARRKAVRKNSAASGVVGSVSERINGWMI